jgi:predicted metallo-beta-lactamase superfamily hydrolase
MASYLETLTADRERMRRALMGQIEEEAAAIRQLQEELEQRSVVLDQKIVRLMVFRSVFGPSQQETLNAQVDVEEASKPHTAARELLAYHQKVLQALQEALLRLQQTGSIEPGSASTGDAKLTVADILGE